MKTTIDQIIQSYTASGLNKELNGITNIQDAVKSQYYDGTQYRCCSHQYRVRKKALDDLLDKLEGEIIKIKAVKDFDELYDVVDNIRVKHIGYLTIYDISLRIGYMQNPKILPQKYVYLHAGAMVGAMTLYNKGLLKVKPVHKMNVQDFNFLSKIMQLDSVSHSIPNGATFAMLVESFLCSKHNELSLL